MDLHTFFANKPHFSETKDLMAVKEKEWKRRKWKSEGQASGAAKFSIAEGAVERVKLIADKAFGTLLFWRV